MRVYRVLFGIALTGLAYGQAVNPDRANVVTTPWSVNWLTHADDATGPTALGYSAWEQLLIGAADLPAWLTGGATGPPLTVMGDGANTLTVARTLDQGQIYDIRRYGALGGPVNDTKAVQAAIDAAEAAGSGIVHIPPGTWNFQVTLDAAGTARGAPYPIIQGAGTHGTIIRAIDPNAACIRITGEGYWRYPYVIRDLRIEGNARDANGISVDGGNGVFGLLCENVAFVSCDIGVHNRGLLWYQFDFCTFVACNYGLRIEARAGSHGGCGYINGCNVSSNKLAGIYTAGYQVNITNAVVEDNAGFGVFIDGAHDYFPTKLTSVWFESNGSAASVTIDGTAYTPSDRDVYIQGGGRVIFETMSFPQTYIEGSTHVTARDCAMGDGEYATVASSDAILTIEGAIATTTNTRYGRVSKWYTPGAISDTSIGPTEPNAVKQVTRTDATSQIAWDQVNLWPEGSMSIPFTPGNLLTCTATWLNAGAPIWGACVQISGMDANGTDYTTGVRDLLVTACTVTEDKWYYFSVDLKANGSNGYVSMLDRISGTSPGLIDIQGYTPALRDYGWVMYAGTDYWRRYVMIRQAPLSGTMDELRVYNPFTTTPDILIANLQLVEFDTAQSVYEYAQRNAVAPGSWVPRTYLADDPNTTDPVTVVHADNGKTFSNRGAGDTTEWDLPAAIPGQRFAFVRIADFTCTVDPRATDCFRTDGGAGDYLQLDTVGDSVTIQCFSAGVWDIMGGYGTYTFEP